METVHPAIEKLRDAVIPPKTRANIGEVQSVLYSITLECLQTVAREELDLVSLNAVGIFHKIAPDVGDICREVQTYKSVLKEYIGMDQEYISPLAMLKTRCTFKEARHTLAAGWDRTPVRVAQLTFHPGFKLFDWGHEPHRKEWNE